MLNKIKALADEAIALQNKNRMDEVLREISAMCEHKKEVEIKRADASNVASKLVGESKPIAKGKNNAK